MSVLVYGGGGYAADGTGIAAVSLAAVLLVGLTQPGTGGSDVPQDLTGRSFVQRILNPDGSTAASVAGAILSGGLIRFTLAPSALGPILPSGVTTLALDHTIRELITSGEVILLQRPFTLLAGGATGGGGGGDSAVRVITTAGAVTVADGDEIISIQNGVATVVDLPASPATGRVLTIKDGLGVGAAITVTPAAGTIDGAADYVLANPFGSITIFYDGTQWANI